MILRSLFPQSFPSPVQWILQLELMANEEGFFLSCEGVERGMRMSFVRTLQRKPWERKETLKLKV